MSKPEDLLAFQLKAAGVPFEREAHAIPQRDFRFDFYCNTQGMPTYTGKSCLVEVQGGIWMGKKGKGAHSTGTAITRDCEKFSLAAAHGYRVLPVTPAQIKSGQALMWVEAALGLRTLDLVQKGSKLKSLR